MTINKQFFLLEKNRTPHLRGSCFIFFYFNSTTCPDLESGSKHFALAVVSICHCAIKGEQTKFGISIVCSRDAHLECPK